MTTQIYNFDVFRGFLAHFLLEEFVSDEISANFHSGDEFGLVENSCPEFFLKIFTLYKLEPKEVAEDALIDQIINDLSFGEEIRILLQEYKNVPVRTEPLSEKNFRTVENKVEYKTISEDRILKEELQRKLNTHFYDEDEKKIKSELLTWCTKKEEKKEFKDFHIQGGYWELEKRPRTCYRVGIVMKMVYC